MQTRLIYENGSLNPHVSRVGMFWDVGGIFPHAVPVLWGAIEKCRFGWSHPLTIEWHPTFMLRDGYGNLCPLLPGLSNADTGTRIDGPYGDELDAGVLLSQSTPRADLSLLICRNERPFAEMPLVSSGSWSLTMPNRLRFQTDCRSRLQERLVEPAGTGFFLTGLRSLRVALRGGTPGAGSTPLTFVSYRAEPA